ncbi:hypothetical protein [Halorubellus salinus]|uniref:hypothetical protein n=1 Tax=Halorubellus salinus TaxID=755309 RepID=UPI001D05EF81|nr:hypothetical protein [Halorubellus salinus]
MDSLSDPGRLYDDDAVDWRDRSHAVDAERFDGIRDQVDSHAVVGITDGDGRVCCHDDGVHGWTLPATTVPDGGDWAVTARRDLGELLGVSLALGSPERIRHVAFTVDDAEDARRVDTFDVVFPARVDAADASPTASIDTEGDAALAWFDDVPPGQDGELVDDVRLFLE